MSKLIYVHEDNEEMFNILIKALADNGYSPEFTGAKDIPAADRLHADMVVHCHKEAIPTRLTIGDLMLDLDAFCAYNSQNQPLHFTPIEFSMLTYLIKNKTRAVSRKELLKAIWDMDSPAGTRVADDTAKRLRKKLQCTSVVIETVWNYGFRIRSI